jgi:hypothetical protein
MNTKSAGDSVLQERHSKLLQAILQELKQLRIGIWEHRQGEKVSYNLREAAELTGLATDTLYHYYKNGKLSGSQPAGAGGAILILRQDLLKLIESGKDRHLE